MANRFDFQLTADDQVSQSIQNIDDAVKNLLPQLNKARTGLKLGGRESVEDIDEISGRFGNLAKNARDGVQFVGDLVPPLKMVGGLTLGLSGLAAGINAVKNGIKDYANAGYKIDTTSKNISTTARAYQELTGAMIENGATRDAADSAVTGLYQRANDAVQGRDNGFVSFLAQLGIKVNKTKEGVADVVTLMDDLNKAMQKQSPAKQAVIAQVGGFSPDLLNFLRQSTEQVQRLKDQAQRDGLIFSDQDVQNALKFRQNINQISSAWDGMLMKGEAWLGQSKTVQKSFDDASQIMKHGLDSATVGSLMTWNSGGEQADRLREAQGNDDFKSTLSFKEKMDLRLGYASPDLVKKLNGYYGPTDKAKQLQQDVKGLYVNPPAPVNQTPSNNARGIRNNNPGNLRVAPNASGNDGSFAIFDRAEDGIAAMSRQLQLYGDRGNNTPYGIIHTYAPRNENNSQAYLSAVTQETGFNAHEPLDLSDPQVLKRMMSAMIRHENGAQPYSEKEIDGGINASMTDPRWQGLRDPNRLATQRDQYSDWLLNGSQSTDNKSINQPPLAEDGGINQPPHTEERDINHPPRAEEGNIILGTQNAVANGEVHIDTQKIADAISSALKENDSKLEVTFINGQSGSRHKATGHGGKVTVAMPLP